MSPKDWLVTSGEQFTWNVYTLPDELAEFAPGTLVIDVGCGDGKQLRWLAKRGCAGVGLDIDAAALANCRRYNLPVVLAQAEHMPLRSAAFGGLICNVALPYTDEARVMREIGRVLKPSGRGFFCYHGAGYFLRYILAGPTLKMRFYGVRSLVNTWVYRITGRRLPGFWGDTLFQTHGGLLKYYRRNGLRLVQAQAGKTFLGLSVFMYHMVEKV